MATVVRAEFEVKVSPQKPDNPEAESAGLGRMSLDKRFHGALEATQQRRDVERHDRSETLGCLRRD